MTGQIGAPNVMLSMGPRVRRDATGQVGCSHGRAAHRRQDASDDRQVTA